jgi:hypothetical protein
MILKELAIMGKIEFVARAPYKREVEDLNYDEIMEILENKVPLADAEFVMDDSTVAQFLSTSGAEPKIKKSTKFTGKDGRKSKKPDTKKERTSSPTKKDDRRSTHSRGDRKPSHRRSDGSSRPISPRLHSSKEGRRDSGRSRDRRSSDRGKPQQRRISIPKAILQVIEKTKKTFSAVLLGKSNKTLTTVKTAEVYDTLVQTDGVESIIVDGVITQRLLDLADDKSVKLVAGAALGEITNKPKDLQYTTFNRI